MATRKGCLICGKKIPTWRKFCSQKCYWTTSSKRFIGENNPMWQGGLVERTCKMCKKKFLVKRGILKRKNGGIYCSNACLGVSKRNENSPFWKGDEVGYNGIHHWLKKNYGKPKICQNKFCEGNSKNYHWANISNNYKRDINDWARLCASCHKTFDCQKVKFEIKK